MMPWNTSKTDTEVETVQPRVEPNPSGEPPALESAAEREWDPIGDAVMNNFASVTVELLFSVLPLVILMIVHAYLDSFPSVFSLPEWALIAAVLFGQTIAKTTSGAIAFANKASINYHRITLDVTLIIVFGLVPSLVVLVLILISPSPRLGLTITQIVLFLLSLVTFFAYGGTMQWEQRRAESVQGMNLLWPEPGQPEEQQDKTDG